MSILKRRLIVLLTGIGITLVIAGLTPILAAHAQEATPEPVATVEPVYTTPENEIVVTGNNSYCASCHSLPWQTITLQNGTLLNLYASPDMIARSIHGTRSEAGALGCVDCHGPDTFPHDGPTPEDARTYSLNTQRLCVGCHADQVNELESGRHSEAIRNGNVHAAVCTDCHGAHDVQAVAEFPGLIAGVCGDCHTQTLEEWQAGPHVSIGKDGCGNCHSPHSQEMRLGEAPQDMCLNCHKEMPDVLIHMQHVNSTDSSVTCNSCHMFTGEGVIETVEISTIGGVPQTNLGTGHSMAVNTTACNTCHEQTVATGNWTGVTEETAALQAERDALVQRVNELEQGSGEVENAGEISYVQLLQGLILGLGFGDRKSVV